MNRIKNTILTLLLLATTMTGCRVAPTNGNLDAQWQMMSFVINSTGEEMPVEGKYWCIYRNLIQFPGFTTGELVMHDGKLSFNFPYVTDDAQTTTLNSWGVESANATFDVVKLNSKHMVLRSDYSTLTFRRF